MQFRQEPSLGKLVPMIVTLLLAHSVVMTLRRTVDKSQIWLHAEIGKL